MTFRRPRLGLLAFVAILAVLALVATIVWAFHLERKAQEERRKDRAFLVSRTDHLLCERMNRERDILGDLIRRIIAQNTTTESRKQAAEFFAQELERLKPEDCTELPSANGEMEE